MHTNPTRLDDPKLTHNQLPVCRSGHMLCESGQRGQRYLPARPKDHESSALSGWEAARGNISGVRVTRFSSSLNRTLILLREYRRIALATSPHHRPGLREGPPASAAGPRRESPARLIRPRADQAAMRPKCASRVYTVCRSRRLGPPKSAVVARCASLPCSYRKGSSQRRTRWRHLSNLLRWRYAARPVRDFARLFRALPAASLLQPEAQ
jgi:hypothetical protein